MIRDKQLPIPGLEPSPGSPRLEFRLRRKPAGWPAERITFLEKRIDELELEIAILKIQMEKDHA